jgi:RNA polymerase sigma-70 factor (ECF subfamily)
VCTERPSAAAWREFILRYHGILESTASRVVRRWNNSGDETDDLVQEIYLKLCANGGRLLLSFRDENPDALFGFLKVVAINTAHDYFRAKTAAKRGGLVTEQIDECHGARAGTNPELDKLLTLKEIDRIMLKHTSAENGPRDRTVFRLYYRHGLTAKEIAQLPGIGLGAKGVETVIRRLTEAIRKEME